MTVKKKIIIGSIVLAIVSGVIVFLVVKNKKKKNNQIVGDGISTDKSLIGKDPTPPIGLNLTTPPQSVLTSPEYKEIKGKLSYINGTLDTMKLQGGKIVNPKTGTPYSEGLLQYVWLAHNREFKKINAGLVPNASINPYVQKMLNDTIASNDRVFDSSVYNYNAKWYLDYKKRGGVE
jgi:hypothetical protein